MRSSIHRFGKCQAAVLCAAQVIVMGLGVGDSLPAAEGDTSTGQTVQDPKKHLDDLTPNRWVRLHVQAKADSVRFERQAHGGSCFDDRRGQLILFGSNTHDQDWCNSPLGFDPVQRRWTRVYADDDRATYAVNGDGIPVAGERGDHPWAMHTFGAVAYDGARDEMVVACYPAHMIPGRFTDALAPLWPKVKKFPTWSFAFASQQWTPLPCEPIHFFPSCAVMDTDRHVVIGYRFDGVYELSGQPRTWTQKTSKVFLGGWHNNGVYDAKNKSLVVFGMNKNSNDIEAYAPATGEHRLMPTPGVRPPKDQHNPMAFDRSLGKTVVLVDRRFNVNGEKGDGDGNVHGSVTETWLYDLANDSWQQLASATLPFACGMNYNMEYDAKHRCLLLVTGDHRGMTTTVWALRIAPVR